MKKKSPYATCMNCRGIKKKKRVELPRGLVLCPDCGHALFWEYLNTLNVRRIAERRRTGEARGWNSPFAWDKQLRGPDLV